MFAKTLGETFMDPLINQHKSTILALASKNGVENVRVFGSMARNDANGNSDVDFLVDLSEGRSGLALGGFLMDVSELLGRKVDVVTEQALHPRIQAQVLSEARLLN